MDSPRVKRKTLALLLFLLMLTGFPVAKAGTPAQVPLGNTLYNQAEQLRGIAVVDGSLYMLSYSSLLRWQPGDEAVLSLAADEPFQVNYSDMLSPMLLSDGMTEVRYHLTNTPSEVQEIMFLEFSNGTRIPLQGR